MGENSYEKLGLALVVVSVLVVQVCSVSIISSVGASAGIDDWPMFHHDLTHTGYSTSIPTATSAFTMELHD